MSDLSTELRQDGALVGEALVVCDVPVEDVELTVGHGILWREGRREGGRERGREGRREGGREGGREEGVEKVLLAHAKLLPCN